MHNALIKQRESIRHVDTILEGIHEIDEAKVLGGLKGLHNIDFNSVATPLSPSFDLVTGISPGREDFLTLELKHLLSLVIRHMAQGVYQWTQQQNKGVANVTQQELTDSLERLIELLEPTKDPCISAITNLNCANAIASCLAIPTSADKWWDRMIFVAEFIKFVEESIEKGKVQGINTALLLLQRLYKFGAKMIKERNDRTLVMQIAAVDAWRRIMDTRDTRSNAEEPPNAKELSKKQIEKTIESLKQYFEGGPLTQENDQKDRIQRVAQKTVQTIAGVPKKAKDAVGNLVQAAPPYRKRLTELLYKAIAELEENINNQDASQDRNISEALRRIAFHALVDMYVETTDESVRCEILKVFGTLARDLCQKSSFDDKQLNSLIDKSEPIKASDFNAIEKAALRILVEAVCPTMLNPNDPVALSLTSGEAIELSQKWQMQCTAIEELLRFDDHYLEKHEGSKGNKKAKTPISSLLDEMGKEYQLTALLLNKFRLNEKEIKSLKGFLRHAKELNKARELLRTAFSLQEKTIEKLGEKSKERKKSIVKEFLAPELEKKKIKEESREEFLKYLLRKDKNDALKFPYLTAKELKIEPLDIDLISNFLRGDISQKELATKKEGIKQWLKTKLKLEDTECNTLIQFLQEDKAQQPAHPQQEKYSDDSQLRAVLDKLIDQFNLTQTERDLIDETIFKGQQSKHTAKESLIEKIGEALKNFFGKDNYHQIACAFNSLDRIKAMIKEERLLLDKRDTEVG